MRASELWNDIDVKLIAILRGIKSKDTKVIVEALLDTGFRAIEIPLNSPDPFTSIRIAVEIAKNHSITPCLIGAGTVLSVQDVNKVYEVGGNLIVSPNVDADVIERTKELDMLSTPGVFTPSECLSALNAGADILKIFPASNLGTNGIKALKAVLPNATQICAVGSVGETDFQNYLDAGAVGFGLGSSLFDPSLSSAEVFNKAKYSAQAYLDCKD